MQFVGLRFWWLRTVLVSFLSECKLWNRFKNEKGRFTYKLYQIHTNANSFHSCVFQQEDTKKNTTTNNQRRNRSTATMTRRRAAIIDTWQWWRLLHYLPMAEFKVSASHMPLALFHQKESLLFMLCILCAVSFVLMTRCNFNQTHSSMLLFLVSDYAIATCREPEDTDGMLGGACGTDGALDGACNMEGTRLGLQHRRRGVLDA